MLPHSERFYRWRRLSCFLRNTCTIFYCFFLPFSNPSKQKASCWSLEVSVRLGLKELLTSGDAQWALTWQTLLGGAFWIVTVKVKVFYLQNRWMIRSYRVVGRLGERTNTIHVNQLPVLRWWVVKISPLFGCATGGWSIIFVSFVKGVYFKHWSTSQWDQHVFFIFGWLFNSFVFWTCIWVTWSKPPTIANHPMVGFWFPVKGG